MKRPAFDPMVSASTQLAPRMQEGQQQAEVKIKSMKELELMPTTTQITSNGAGAVHPNLADVQEISVQYDEVKDAVMVSPGQVSKGSTVRFKNPDGRLRIVFLSPSGKEMEAVSDSELCKLTIGGTYHFKCFFSSVGQNDEISPASGGVIDVVPQRP